MNNTFAKALLRKCNWREVVIADGQIYWSTTCGNIFEFTDGGPEINGFKFCPYCSRAIKEIQKDRLSDLALVNDQNDIYRAWRHTGQPSFNPYHAPTTFGRKTPK